jgi:hypothetical protein
VKVKRLTTTAAVLSAFVAGTLPAAPASAQGCLPQSTVAALDQYCASLPSSDGAPQPVGSGGGSATPLSAMLPKHEVSKLRAAGMAGQALLSVPSGGARPSRATVERSLPATRKAAEQARSEEKSAAARTLGTAARTLATDAPDVLGGAFRWGLTISTLAIAAMAWLRFRGRIKL